MLGWPPHSIAVEDLGGIAMHDASSHYFLIAQGFSEAPYKVIPSFESRR